MESLAHRVATGVLLLLLCSTISSGCSADCGWSGIVQAFVDVNANAVRDNDEPSLSGVKVRVLDFQGNGGYGGG